MVVVNGMTRVMRSVVVGETVGRGREVRARAVLLSLIHI